jgi:CCR4-NOT transcription complex subunit 1
MSFQNHLKTFLVQKSKFLAE